MKSVLVWIVTIIVTGTQEHTEDRCSIQWLLLASGLNNCIPVLSVPLMVFTGLYSTTQMHINRWMQVTCVTCSITHKYQTQTCEYTCVMHCLHAIGKSSVWKLNNTCASTLKLQVLRIELTGAQNLTCNQSDKYLKSLLSVTVFVVCNAMRLTNPGAHFCWILEECLDYM